MYFTCQIFKPCGFCLNVDLEMASFFLFLFFVLFCFCFVFGLFVFFCLVFFFRLLLMSTICVITCYVREIVDQFVSFDLLLYFNDCYVVNICYSKVD